MKNPSLALRKAYYTYINGLGLTFNGNPLPIYNGMAPDTATDSYIILSSVNCPTTPDKATYTFKANILIDIVNKSCSFGYQPSDTIASSILAIINPDSSPNLSPDFQCVNTTLLGLYNREGLNNTEPFFRTLIQYGHLITQL